MSECVLIQQCVLVLTCQRSENHACQANCNFSGEKTKRMDCFVAVPDCSRELAVTYRVDDDRLDENSRAHSCVEGRARGM